MSHQDRVKIYRAITRERIRQDELFPGQAPEEPLGQAISQSGGMLGILIEEVGEVAKAINEEDRTALADELVHVAAVVVKWCEAEIEHERQWDNLKAEAERNIIAARFHLRID